jgi:site-specific DNA-methyltransferase (adenine-specific)
LIELNKIYHGDCLELSNEVESGSVDLILTDLPYGTMKGAGLDGWGNDKTSWDIAIEPKKVYEIANRILRKNGKMVLFSQEPYTTRLISEAISNVPFNYRMIWEKDHFANSLIAKKAPVSYYEDVLVFSKSYEVGKDIVPDNPVYHYLKECRIKSGLSIKEYNYRYSDYVGKTKNRHRGMVARCWETSQFWVPNRDIYENVLQPTGFFPLPYEEIEKMDKKESSTFNLWEGKKYKSNILKYKKDYSGFHPTQKPVLLLEDLLKTFSNEGDLIVDLTIGSGSTALACINTHRKYIGFELNEEYYRIANERIHNLT